MCEIVAIHKHLQQWDTAVRNISSNGMKMFITEKSKPLKLFLWDMFYFNSERFQEEAWQISEPPDRCLNIKSAM